MHCPKHIGAGPEATNGAVRDVLSADRDEKSPSAEHDLLTSMPHGELVEQASQPPVAAAGSSPRYDAGAKLTTPPCG